MKLTDDNFELFAAKAYDSRRTPSVEEFQNDLKKIVYIHKLLSRYANRNDLQLRLILNHMIVFYNCFGHAATPLLMMKLSSFHHELKPIIEFLGYLPSTVEYNDVVINTSSIEPDLKIKRELKKI